MVSHGRIHDDCAEDPLAPRSSPEGGAPSWPSVEQPAPSSKQAVRPVCTPQAGRHQHAAKSATFRPISCCLPALAEVPGALPTWALGAQGPVYAWVEIEARLWGRRAARASIVPACYDYRGAMSTLDASTRARVGAPWGSSWNRTPAFDGKAGPWALGLGGSPVLDETVGNVGEIFWNCSWAC